MGHSTCSFDGCDRLVKSNGLCDTHDRQMRRTGRLAPIRAHRRSKTVEERFWEKVEKTDTCWLWTARRFPLGYGEFWAEKHREYAHRWSYEDRYGPIPEGMEIDHACHVPACVNPDHLRLATRADNVAYRRGATRMNKGTGIRNVYPAKRKTRPGWRVYVARQAGGVYDTIEEAEAVAKAMRAAMFDFPDFNSPE